MEFNLFLPQMRMSFDQLVARARAAEAAGFVGITGMDHLAPPMADDQPMFEAMVTTTWLAAHTERLRVGSLVLCDAFRHPAVLARQAVSIDHASGGRFDLGIGWGSVPEELATFGVGSTEARDRVERLRETLEVVRALWAGETVDYDGELPPAARRRQEPRPLGPHPDRHRRHRPQDAGARARVRRLVERAHRPRSTRSTSCGRRSATPACRSSRWSRSCPQRRATATRSRRSQNERFGFSRPVIGSGAELVEHYGRLAEQGIERVYTWFCDFAPPETLAEFGEEVIAPLRG